MDSYIPIAVMISLAFLIALIMVGGSFFLGPKKPGAVKDSVYECGMEPVGTARERFPVKFFLVAMLYIVFDVETIFLYPWAVSYHELPYAMKVFNYAEMAVFVAILFAGYFYILGSGALDWAESERGISCVPEAYLRSPRPAILFGNENSGPVDLSKTPAGPLFPVYGDSSQEQFQNLPQGHNPPPRIPS